MPFDLAEHPTEVQQQIDGLPDDARPDFDAAVAFAPSSRPRRRLPTAEIGLKARCDVGASASDWV